AASSEADAAGVAGAVAEAVTELASVEEVDAQSVIKSAVEESVDDKSDSESEDTSDVKSVEKSDAKSVDQAEPEAAVVAVPDSVVRLLPEHYQAAIEACGRAGNTRGVLALLDELRLGGVSGSGGLEAAAQLTA
ncbi:unnamed protein product, partial [Laminaria digitata]